MTDSNVSPAGSDSTQPAVSSLKTLVLWAIEFPKEAKPGLVDEEIIWWLGFIEGPTMIAAGLIAAGFYAQYRINKDKYEATKVALAKRTT